MKCLNNERRKVCLVIALNVHYNHFANIKDLAIQQRNTIQRMHYTYICIYVYAFSFHHIPNSKQTQYVLRNCLLIKI